MIKSFVNQKGQVLIIVLAVIAALTVYGLSLLKLTDPELKISKRQIDSTKAFYIAEAGIDRVFYCIKRDGDTDDITFNEEGFGGGDYTISKTEISFNKWTIKSTGKYNNSTRSIQVDVEVENVSVWNNAICGGSGATGAIINGNADFRGSLHLLGEELSATDIAINLSGTAGVGNNYEGMDTDLLSKVPPLESTFFNGEWVEFLNAKLRVKHGKVNISGTATVGDPDEQENGYKETMDGVYVTDGFGGNKGESNVYSDNGTENEYDLGEVDIVFPSLYESYTDPETSIAYTTYLDYLKDTGLDVNDLSEVPISEISADILEFEYGVVEGNYIKWVPGTGTDPGILTIEGIIWVDNPDVGLVIGKSKGTIIFEGKGTLVSANDGADISIHCNLLSEGTSPDVTFPTEDCLGIISARDIHIATEGDANLNVMGAFYAEDKITMVKQTDLVGTFVSKYVDMGTNVPKIYQVPTLADNLPPGMPGLSIIYSLIITNWREVSN